MKNSNLFISFLILISNITLAESSKVIHCMADIRTLSTSVKIYKMETEKYPSSENWEQELKEYIYEHENFTDPWENKYIYCYPGIHNKESFDIYSLGKDGLSETGGNDKDDVNNWDPDHTWLYEAYGALTKTQALLLEIAIIAFWVFVIFIFGYGIFFVYKKIRNKENP